MNHGDLRERVCEANREISRVELAILTWGNASEVDRDAGVFAIKPSGVDYGSMTPGDIPVISLDTGEQLEGSTSPSTDTASHWQLYRSFETIGGIVHTHSLYATAWAQARREIPCLGTTHADAFYGPVPCTRKLTKEEVEGEYELNTGKVVVEHFLTSNLDPVAIPGALVACHGPFAWGKDAMAAVVNGQTLEEIAHMAAITLLPDPTIESIDQYLLDKHYLRKHGDSSYYGQK